MVGIMKPVGASATRYYERKIQKQAMTHRDWQMVVYLCWLKRKESS